MENSFLFLGTGGSMGVPAIGCGCTVCRSASSYNQRLRPAGLLQLGGKRFLIDAGPDFRAQALRFGIKELDGVLITHTHFDHIAGFDDLRVFYFLHKKRVPCLLSQESLAELKIRYHYFFDEHKSMWLDFTILEELFGRVTFQDVSFEFVSYFQTGMTVTGYRFGSFAYISDIRRYDDRLTQALQGLETLVVSATRMTPTEAHFSISEAIEFSKQIGAKKVFFTHIMHELDHEETNRHLPENVRLGYDGLKIKI